MCAWKFHFVTFGCKVNQYETQALREAWTAQGGTECDSPDAADVVCINSCAITARGERDARNALFRVRRDAPGARVLLTGCAARLVAGQTAAGRDAPDAVTLSRVEGRIDVDHVSFAYQDDLDVLHDVDLHIRPGETVVVLGGGPIGLLIAMVAREAHICAIDGLGCENNNLSERAG